MKTLAETVKRKGGKAWEGEIMNDFYREVSEVNSFLKEKKMQAFDLMRIAKMLCCCGTCKFFVQHYTKDGNPLDWGHCCKGNVQHSKRISTASCGSWDYE